MTNWRLVGPSSSSNVLGLALVVVAIAAGLVNIMVMHTTAPVANLVFAVIVSAWFGGTKYGLAATGLCGAALAYFIFFGGSPAVDGGDLPRLLYFLALACFIVWIIGSERKTAASLRRARDELERRNQALQIANTEGKALEEVLRLNQTRLRLVIDTIPTMAWSLLPDGKMEFLNQRWLDYSGVSLQAAIEDGTGTIHPEDRARSVEKWQEALARREAYEEEMRLRRADGQYRWFLVRTVPLLEDGRIVRWYGTSTDIEDRKRAEEERKNVENALRSSAASLQHLSRRLLEVQEQERRHLARELHDEFGQLLATVNLHLHAAKTVAGEAARAKLEESTTLLQHAGERVRSLALELRPAMLETAGLDSTLRWLARHHEQRTGMAAEVVGHLNDIDADQATACFRVAQEALTNAVRHARARHAWIELSHGDGRAELVVRDDGAGFDVPKVLNDAIARGHLGLLGMKERVQILGGDLQIDSQPGEGTRIRVAFPTAKSAGNND